MGTDLEASPQSYRIARAIRELLTGANSEKAKATAGHAEGQDVSAATVPEAAAGAGAGVVFVVARLSEETEPAREVIDGPPLELMDAGEVTVEGVAALFLRSCGLLLAFLALCSWVYVLDGHPAMFWWLSCWDMSHMCPMSRVAIALY